MKIIRHMTSFSTLTRFSLLEQYFYFCSQIAECAHIAEFSNIAESFGRKLSATLLPFKNSAYFYRHLPESPSEHSHANDPKLLTHVAFSSQTSSRHSFLSSQVNRSKDC